MPKLKQDDAWPREFPAKQLGQAAISPRMGPHLALQKHARQELHVLLSTPGAVTPGEVLQASGAWPVPLVRFGSLNAVVSCF